MSASPSQGSSGGEPTMPAPRPPASSSSSSSKSLTPISSTGKRAVTPPRTGASAPGSGVVDTMRRRKSSIEGRKKTFTTSRTFPEAQPTASAAMLPEGELQRSQRRSKVAAISKIDKVNPGVVVAGGPAATSFLPAGSGSLPNDPSAAGPSVSRNPLHRPPVVNPPFDMATVRTEAPRHPPNRSGERMFGLEECPVYYPTESEFTDPMEYISSITPSASPYGICKIVPPEGWQMPFKLSTDTFRFRTRLQRINSLEAASRAKLNFLDQLTMFHLQQGDSKVTIPVFDRRPLDLWKLRKEITKLGGYDATNRLKAWGNVAEVMGYDATMGPHLHEAYQKIVFPFDQFAARAKSASVSPLTPMTGPTTAPGKPPGWAVDSPGSPTMPARVGRMGAVPQPRRPTRMSGSAPASAPAAPPPPIFAPRKSPPGTLSLPPDPAAVSNKPLSAVSTSASSLPSATGSGIKLRIPGFSSREGTESDLSSEDSLSPPPSIKSSPKDEYQKGEVCEICQRGHNPEKMLLCDGCDRGFHIYCLDPPLASVPTNAEWFCTPCLLSQGDDYGFEEGEDHSIPAFQARDAAFSYHWWNMHRPAGSSQRTGELDPLSRRFGKAVVSEADVEREFWRLTESNNDTVEVEYGADVHSTTHGSAAPIMETHPLDPYSKSGWNLNNMPILPQSLLRYIKSDISGMTVPWIYIGMMFSTFCWHNEDHYTYSVNYMFWGETKTWYGIPGEDAYKFEEAIKSEAPELFEQQPGLLFQLVTMMNPGRLKEAGVRVVACDQRPNEFVITFPKAYHCGFNHGINFNEAVNFALPDWLPDGKECVTRYREHAKPPVFSHNELLVTITLYSETIKTALWLKDSLAEMVEQETALRESLRAKVPGITEKLEEEDCPEEQYQCCICKGFCYLSQVTCTCTKLVACIDHADTLCSCDPGKRTLRKRYSETQLEDILEAITLRAGQPEQWRNRLMGLLEAPRPPLKSMRALLTDGEKIAYPIPEVADLRELVGRANAWIDKVTALSTRKPTGRRKKGGAHADEPDADRNPDTIAALIREVEHLAFDAPEIMSLRQMLLGIENFRHEANLILGTPENELDVAKCKTALILGNSLQVDMPEVAQITTIVNRLEWFRRVEEDVDDKTIQYAEVVELLEEAEDCEIPDDHPTILELRKREAAGRKWKADVERILGSDSIELSDLDNLIEGQEMTPTTLDTMRSLEAIRKTALGWQLSASGLLSGTGTYNSAVRLCKSVKSATGPTGRVNVPEVDELAKELEFNESWAERLAEVLGVATTKTIAELNRIRVSVKEKTAEEDDVPSAEHSCFCRGPPAEVMATCGSCQGQYHFKCITTRTEAVTPKNITPAWRCAMCNHVSADDRASLTALAEMASPTRWDFLLPPPQLAIIQEILTVAMRFIPKVLTAIDVRDQAVPVKDFELLTHYCRKIYWAEIRFDLMSAKTHEVIILEDWLYARFTELFLSQHTLVAPVPHGTKRSRRPRFILAEPEPVGEGEVSCICDSPPLDHLLQVKCNKCARTYHMSCVRAPPKTATEEQSSWKCMSCCVKEGKRYIKDLEVRVQMKDLKGTSTFVDYPTTYKSFAPAPIPIQLPPSTAALVLFCEQFVPGYQAPVEPKPAPTAESPATGMAGGEDDRAGSEDEHKKKKRRPSAKMSDTPDGAGQVEVEIVNAPGSTWPGARNYANGTTNGNMSNGSRSISPNATLNGTGRALDDVANGRLSNGYASAGRYIVSRDSPHYASAVASLNARAANASPVDGYRPAQIGPGRTISHSAHHPWTPIPRPGVPNSGWDSTPPVGGTGMFARRYSNGRVLEIAPASASPTSGTSTATPLQATAAIAPRPTSATPSAPPPKPTSTPTPWDAPRPQLQPPASKDASLSPDARWRAELPNIASQLFASRPHGAPSPPIKVGDGEQTMKAWSRPSSAHPASRGGTASKESSPVPQPPSSTAVTASQTDSQ